MKTITKPNDNEFASYYKPYIRLVTEDALEGMHTALQEAENMLGLITPEKATYRYGTDKWSVNEVIAHVIDCERIFCYRALSFVRGDKDLPGFNHQSYVEQSMADYRTTQSLLEELKTVRLASISLFASFNDDQLQISGKANNNPISVRTIAYLLVGHQRHHFTIIKNRYLL